MTIQQHAQRKPLRSTKSNDRKHAVQYSTRKRKGRLLRPRAAKTNTQGQQTQKKDAPTPKKYTTENWSGHDCTHQNAHTSDTAAMCTADIAKKHTDTQTTTPPCYPSLRHHPALAHTASTFASESHALETPRGFTTHYRESGGGGGGLLPRAPGAAVGAGAGGATGGGGLLAAAGLCRAPPDFMARSGLVNICMSTVC